jgi:uncharacterized protein YozE (UPF0346 family)
MKRLTFYNYLKKQKNRDDPVGDLAADVLADKSFPKNVSCRTELLEYLNNTGACYEALTAAKEAFTEYKLTTC